MNEFFFNNERKEERKTLDYSYIDISLEYHGRLFPIYLKKQDLYNFYVKYNVIDKEFIKYYIFNFIMNEDERQECVFDELFSYVLKICDNNVNFSTYTEKDSFTLM